jgi:translation initiation factor 2A
MAAAAALPAMRLAVRSKDGVFLLPHEPRAAGEQGLPAVAGAPSPTLPCEAVPVAFSADGQRVALVSAPGVVDVLRCADLARLRRIDTQAPIAAVALSPLGTFVVVHNKAGAKKEKEEAEEAGSGGSGGGGGNLAAWEVESGREAARFFQKEFRPQQGINLVWTADEAVAARTVSNEVHFFKGRQPAVREHILVSPGLTTFALSPVRGPPPREDGDEAKGGGRYGAAPALPLRVATFAPGKRDMPATVRVWDYPRFGEGQCRASRSMFRVDAAALQWSPAGQALLVRTTSEASAGGDNYYAEMGLQLLFADGSLQCEVPFAGGAGPVHDARWAPSGREFIAVQGRQPAQAVIFQAEQCTALYILARGAFNTVRWSPQGRFIMLGGFQGLSGAMEFYDAYKKRKLGEARDLHSPQLFEWLPDGRALITATVVPRQVDFGFKVWSYAGELLYERKQPEQLLQVEPAPCLPGIFPDRPISPRVRDRKVAAAGGGAAGAAPPAAGGATANATAAAATAPKAGAYVPPHLRNRAAGIAGSLQEQLRNEERSATSTKPQKLGGAGGKGGGGAAAAAAAKGGAKGKAGKRGGQAAAAGEEEEGTRIGLPAETPEERALRERLEKAEKMSAEEKAKRRRVLRKKLAEIEGLKELRMSTLTKEQVAKLAQEDALRAELDVLGGAEPDSEPRAPASASE